MSIDPQAAKQMLSAMLQPWHNSVADPAAAQQRVLETLLEGYAKTEYGQEHKAADISTVEEYRRAFPIRTYEAYKPLIDLVMAGETGVLLYEEPVGWAITRGTTKGESKFIPMTETDLRQRISAGRAMMNYVLDSGRVDLFDGINLNLNFPSTVGRITVGETGK